MCNLLIVDNDLEYSKKIINYIAVKCENVRVIAIAMTIEEIIQMLELRNINTIILNVDSFLYKKVKEVSAKYKIKLLCVGEKAIGNHKYNRNDFKNIFLKLNEIMELNVKKITEKNEKQLKNRIELELEYLGFNITHIGTKYLKECIYIMYFSKEELNDNLQKYIYPIVAMKFNKSINNVKCNIVNATNIMYYECKEKKLIEYLADAEIEKPGPKKIMLTVLKKIKA